MDQIQIYESIVRSSRKGSKPYSTLRSLHPEIYDEYANSVDMSELKNTEKLYGFLLPNASRLCRICESPTEFDRFPDGYKLYCGKRCWNIGKSTVECAARESTNMSRYGVRSPAQNDDVMSRMKNTFDKNFGAGNPEAAKDLKERTARTNIARYGHENVFSSPEVQKKIRESNMEKYGVENALQRPDVMKKHSRKRYRRHRTVVDGVVFSTQGYEHHAIRWMVSEFGISARVLSGDVIPIPYEYLGRSRVYIPDFLSGSVIVEVKSDYTAGLTGKKEYWDMLCAKMLAARSMGYTTLLLVMNGDGSINRLGFNCEKLENSLSEENINEIIMEMEENYAKS